MTHQESDYVFDLTPEQEALARSLHRSCLTVDALSQHQMVMDARFQDRTRRGGWDCIFITATTPITDNFACAVRHTASIIGAITRGSEPYVLATSVADIRRAKDNGQVAVVLLSQDPCIIEYDLDYLRTLYYLGLRVMQIAYTQGGPLGAGCGELKDAGLTFMGRDAVELMNELGMLIDLSHVGDQTCRDVLAHSRAPVVCTHSNSRSLLDSARNKPDDILKAIAESGGMVGTVAATGVVTRRLPATIEDYLDHVDYLVRLLGEDYVGLGIDTYEFAREDQSMRPGFSYYWHRNRPDIFGPEDPTGNYPPMPTGLQSVAEGWNITRGLVARGYSETAIEKLLGANWLRVCEQVWRS